MKRRTLSTFFILLLYNCIAEENKNVSEIVMISPIGWQEETAPTPDIIKSLYGFSINAICKVENNSIISIIPCKVSGKKEIGENRFQLILGLESKIEIAYSGIENTAFDRGNLVKNGDKICSLHKSYEQFFLHFIIINKRSFDSIKNISDNEIQFIVPQNTKIYALFNGKSESWGYDESDGYYFDLKNEFANFRYKYLRSIFFFENNQFKQGQVIGLSGESGSIDQPTLGIERKYIDEKCKYLWIYVIVP